MPFQHLRCHFKAGWTPGRYPGWTLRDRRQPIVRSHDALSQQELLRPWDLSTTEGLVVGGQHVGATCRSATSCLASKPRCGWKPEDRSTDRSLTARVRLTRTISTRTERFPHSPILFDERQLDMYGSASHEAGQACCGHLQICPASCRCEQLTLISQPRSKCIRLRSFLACASNAL